MTGPGDDPGTVQLPANTLRSGDKITITTTYTVDDGGPARPVAPAATEPQAAYGHDDWDYYETVHVYCKRCDWTVEVGWSDYDDGPEGAYAEHWEDRHATKGKP